MRSRRAGEPGAIDILEEAFRLLRRTPASAHLIYYAGSLPFVLSLLFFWADMCFGAFANEHVGVGALGLALLYGWMKCWQALFARTLHARLTGWPAARRNGRWRFLGVQVALHPLALPILPVSLVLTLPFGWVYAFFQALTITGDVDEAKRHATLWPKQNHALIGILFLFGGFVFINVASAMAAAPFLLRMLLGIQTAVTRSPLTLFNTTFFAAALGLAYLAMGPVVKATYVVRGFHADARTTGQDLRAAFRSASAVVAFCALAFGLPALATAAEAPPRAPAAAPAGVGPSELEHAIDEVLQNSEFSWRLRRKLEPDAVEESWTGRLMAAISRPFLDVARTVGRWIERFFDWLEELLNRGQARHHHRPGLGWLSSVQSLFLVFFLLAAAAGALLLWRARRRRPQPMTATLVPARPDLEADDSIAAEAPSEHWVARARELIERGELRLAMRALYLAGLAQLARRELVRLARFKSNLDYQRELDRRARRWPRLAELFAESVDLVEPVWYGNHPAGMPSIEKLTANLSQLEAHGPS